MTIPALALCALLAQSPVETFLYSDLGSNSEAAIPRHLIWGLNGVAPERFGATEEEFFDRYGMIPNPATPGLPYGIVPVRDPLGVPYLVFNCAWCHVGKVGGRVYLGAGNRELRQAELTRDLIQFTTDPRFDASRLIAAAAREARRRGELWHLTDSFELTLATVLLRSEQAQHWRSDDTEAGPGFSIPSIIAMEKRFGMKPPDGLLPAVKYPSIWSYGHRRTFSSGGNFQGNIARTMMAPEFTKGREVRNILRHTEPFDAVYAWMLAQPPPKFPFAIDAALAKRGEDVYDNECLGCHGTNWQGTYQEQVTPIAEVRTDADRLNAFARGFAAKANLLKIPETHVVESAGGYVAIQHDGVWARPPFLHNGSVPSLRWLLTAPEDRPKIFYLGRDVPYSPDDVGDACREMVEDGVKACAPAHEGLFRFDTRQHGRGNGGHDFGSQLPEPDKRALLEYLKTL